MVTEEFAALIRRIEELAGLPDNNQSWKIAVEIAAAVREYERQQREVPA